MTENIDKAEGIDRRSVIKAAAWAAPVVAVAVSAPVAAATTIPIITGANISAANFGEARGAILSLLDENFSQAPFPAGTVVTLVVTGDGVLENVRNVSGGAFDPVISDLTAGTYTILPNGGAGNFNFRGDLTGTLTLTATISFTDADGNPQVINTQSATLQP